MLQCEVDGRMLSTVTATDDVDTGDFAEVVFKAETGRKWAVLYKDQISQ